MPGEWLRNKIKADRYFDEYMRTADPGRLDRVHKLDVAAGIALVVSEVSLAASTYLLFTR